MAKRGRGRPVVFTPAKARKLVSLVRKHGLSGTIEFLKTNPVQFKKDGAAETVTISMPTLGKLAKNAGLKLERGRPPVKKAA